MDKLIKVTGTGKMSIQPDQIRLLLNLQETRETYEETLRLSTVQADEIKDVFEKLGFNKEDLKTISFNINTQYESYQDKSEWKQRLIGFEFRHALKVEFNLDNKLLGRILNALANGKVNPEIQIIYTIKDIDIIRCELLAKAVEDSKSKAEILAKATGVHLGQVMNIDYSARESDMFNNSASYFLKASSPMNFGNKQDYDMDFVPDHMKMMDIVTVTWGIQ